MCEREGLIHREREGEREGERERGVDPERERERERERQTDRQTDRQTETERQRAFPLIIGYPLPRAVYILQRCPHLKWKYYR